MPAGRSVICASVNGKPGRREVVVDAATAERLQADLEEKLAAFAAHAKPRPCGLFDHKSGAASLIPQRFSWDEERGVLLEAVWTNAGRAAVEGRDYSYWSPSFRLNADGSVVGLQAGVEVGSLVNDPAFERIELVAAGRQEVDEPEEGVVEVNGGGAEVETEDHIAEMGLAELRAELGKRHAAPVIERIKARISELEKKAKEAGDDEEGPEGSEPEEREVSPMKKAHLAALKRLEEVDAELAAKRKPERAKCSKVDFGNAIGVLAGRVAAVAESDADARGAVADLAVSVRAAFEAVDAANPYGCNQYGHGFKREHEGYGSGGQKTLEFDGTDKEYQERKKAFEEAVRKRKERDRRSAERREAEIKKYGYESKREKYERMARERDEKHAAAVKKAEDELRDIEDEQRATWRKSDGGNDGWTTQLEKKMGALAKKEEAAKKRLEDAKRKQADWEGKKKRHWEYDKKWRTSTLFR